MSPRHPEELSIISSSPAPLVSIVLPCYREPASVIHRTLDSVLAQTYPKIEVIVVVDDPDNVALSALVKERAQADDRVKVVVNPHNVGPWASYNRGVREATGEIIAVQDADDVSAPNRIEALTHFLLRNRDVGVVGSALEYVDATSGRVLVTRSYPRDPTRAIRRYSPLAHGTTLRWTHLFQSHGGYSESSEYRHAADYELWCRWWVRGVRMANVLDPLYRYFQSDANFKARNVKAILRDTIRIKAMYARRLSFGIGDYLWLAAETIACLLPAQVVVAAFYIVNRWRSTRLVTEEARKGVNNVNS